MSKKMSTIDKALILLLTPYLLPLEGVVALLNFAEKKKKEKQLKEEERLEEEKRLKE